MLWKTCNGTEVDLANGCKIVFTLSEDLPGLSTIEIWTNSSDDPRTSNEKVVWSKAYDDKRFIPRCVRSEYDCYQTTQLIADLFGLKVCLSTRRDRVGGEKCLIFELKIREV